MFKPITSDLEDHIADTFQYLVVNQLFDATCLFYTLSALTLLSAYYQNRYRKSFLTHRPYLAHFFSGLGLFKATAGRMTYVANKSLLNSRLKHIDIKMRPKKVNNVQKNRTITREYYQVVQTPR